MVGDATVSQSDADRSSMGAAREVWVLSDGKRGHVNQSLGLAEALRRRIGGAVRVVELPAKRSLRGDLRVVREAVGAQPGPAVILAAGHRTHLPLLAAGWWTGGKTVVLMRPTLPGWLFDQCVVPSHDLPAGAADTSRRLVTEGAINRMRYEPGRKEQRGLILVGGPSREHGWDGDHLLEQIRTVAAEDGESDAARHEWTLTDSRRTPAGFREAVREASPEVQCFASRETPADWLPAQLMRAAVVWVTADSVSMMYEALTAGARVGVMDMPLRGRAGKISRTVARLVEGGWVTRWADWRAGQPLVDPPRVLNEADRCAGRLIERLGLTGVNEPTRRTGVEGRAGS